MPFGPVDPQLDLVALEDRALDRWRATDLPAGVPRAPRGRRALGLLRGPAHRQRQARAAPRVGAGVQGPLPPVPDHAGPPRCPARAAGTATACPSSSRSRRRSGCTPSTRSRPTASPSSTSGAATRCTATSRTGPRSPSAPASGSTPPTPTGRSTTTTSSRCGGCSSRCGTTACSTRATASCPTAAAAAPRSRRTRSPRATATSRTRRSTCASRSRRAPHPPRVPTCWCGPPRPGRSCRTWARRSAPTSSTCGCAPAWAACPRAATCSWPTPPGPGASPTPRWSPALRGAELVGTRYQRPFDLLTPPAGADGWRVVAGDFVSTDDGSGIVHLAPAFGEDDALVGRAEGLPVLNPVDATASFDASVAPYEGRFVKDADRDLITDLDARGLLVAEQPYVHSYPHCWRCGTPLIYWAKTSWFARTADRRDDLLEQNERITWHPEHIKHGRFGKWLEGNVDWALSRDRYWGTPLPIWRCTDGHDTCVGSVAQLAELAGSDLSALDLHRPFVDEITFPCPEDGCTATATRLAPVLDAWFDSGAMPSAQRHHPFEGADTFAEAFPADFICEAIDQTRGLVLLPARGQHAGVRVHALPRRHLPRPHRRRRRPEDVQVEGQHRRPVGGVRRARRRRPALVLLLRRAALGAAPRLRRGHPRDHPPHPPHPLELLQLLRHLRRPRRVGAGSRRLAPARRARARPLGAR